MKPPKRGEIVWIEMPDVHVQGHEQHGHPWRPYVIVSQDKLLPSKLCVGCPTSTSASPGWLRVPIGPDRAQVAPGDDGVETGLILVEHLRSIDWQKRMGKPPGKASHRLGRLTHATLADVEEALSELLGLE